MRTPTIAPGSPLWIRHRRWHLVHARRDGSVTQFHVRRGPDAPIFLAPFDRPAIDVGRHRPVRVRRQAALARLAGELSDVRSVDAIDSAKAARIKILPYQLEPTLALLEGHRRLLIADAVGLGKTIQAGLAIAETVRRSPASRVLVVTPASLREQWADELASRFSIVSHCLDGRWTHTGDRLRGTHPWSFPGVWIASTDYLKQPHVIDALPDRPWDLVVVDEAHGVAGHSARYTACTWVCRRAKQMVLLSATPHSGDEGRFDRLLGLGALNGDDPITVFRRTPRDVGTTTTRRVRWCRLAVSTTTRAALEALERYERAVTGGSTVEARDGALLWLSMLRRRAASSMAALAVSAQRRLEWLSNVDADQEPWEQGLLPWDPDTEDAEDSAVGVGWASINLPRSHESRLLADIFTCAREASTDDVKLRRAVALVRRTDRPALVFTEFRDTALATADALAPFAPVSVLHGGLTDAERRIQIEAFKTGRTRVLVTTDVGGQGLNLQRAHWVVNIDIPWNPMRLEQRIGRVDRIGQELPVHVSVLVLGHRTEEAVLKVVGTRATIAARALDQPATTLLALATAVFEGRMPSAPAPRTSLPPPATHWRRRARASAVILERRRRLARHWRTAREGFRTTHWLVPGATQTTVACAVHVRDDVGGELERRLVAIRVPTLGSVDQPMVRARMSRLIARALEPRRRRVARLLAERGARLARTERALDEAQRQDRGLTQASLFGGPRHVSTTMPRARERGDVDSAARLGPAAAPTVVVSEFDVVWARQER